MGVEFEEAGGGAPNGSESSSSKSNHQQQERSSTRSTSRTDQSGDRNSFRSRVARPLGRGNGSEILGKAIRALSEILDSDYLNPDSRFQLKDHKVLPLDSSETGGSPAAAVIVLPVLDNGVNYLFHHTLILEGSGVLPPALEDEYRGKRYVEPVVVADVWDHKNYHKRVEAVVLSQLGRNGNTTLVNCDAHVIYAETNFENDVDNVRQHLFYATAAIATTMDLTLGTDNNVSLSWLGDDDEIEISISYDNTPLLSPDGLPRRTDVKLTSDVSIKNQDNTRDLVPLTIVGGALEMVYAPASPQLGSGWQGRRNRNRDDDTRVAKAAFWINTLDTQTSYITLETLAIGLASVVRLYRPEEWANFYYPGTQSKPTRDIGLLGFLSKEIGNKRVLDTRSANFGWGEYMDVLADFADQDIAIGIEIEKCSEMSWILNTFIAIAEGGDPGKEARRMFVAALDKLTDNRFGDLLGDRPILHDDRNQVLTGYIKGKGGDSEALGEFDLMYLLEHRGADDYELALTYQDTFDLIDDPEDFRLAQRMRQYENHLGNSFRVKNKARRFVFDPAFLEAVADSIIDSGVRFRQVDPGANRERERVHGNSRYDHWSASNIGEDLFRTGRRTRDDRSSRGRDRDRDFDRR